MFLKVLVLLGDKLGILFDLLDLVQVRLQVLRYTRLANPLGGLFDDCLNASVLNHNFDVDRIVHLSKHKRLLRVLQLQVFQQLQPQVFKFVRIVLEQVEIVTNCGQDFVKLAVKLFIWLGDEPDN